MPPISESHLPSEYKQLTWSRVFTMLKKQTRVFTLTLSIRVLVNTSQKNDFMRPNMCSRKRGVPQREGTVHPGLLRSRSSHRDRERREVHVPEPIKSSHPLKFRQNLRACVYPLPHALSLARCTQAARRAPERLPYRTSPATTQGYQEVSPYSVVVP